MQALGAQIERRRDDTLV
jgi:anti-anti-sigma factor